MERDRSTAWTLPPRTISKFRPTRERSIRPFALAFSQPFSVQRRWCSLLWAVVNPLFDSKCRTCFCASISCVFLFYFALLSSARKLAVTPALRYVSPGDMHIELPPSLHIRQNRASPAPKEPMTCGGILPLNEKARFRPFSGPQGQVPARSKEEGRRHLIRLPAGSLRAQGWRSIRRQWSVPSGRPRSPPGSGRRRRPYGGAIPTPRRGRCR